MKPVVVMVGTSLNGRGGMSSVAANYSDAGLFEACNVVYLAAHQDASKWAKLWAVLSSLARLWSLLLRGRVSLVHIHVASGVSFWRKSLFAWSALLCGRPVLLHMHGGEFALFYQNSSWLAKRLISGLMRRARGVALLSQSWVDRLRHICPEAHWLVLPNPVALRPVPSASREADPFLRILFLGRLEHAKGVFELIRAFAQARAQVPRLRLMLAGEGHDRAEVLRLSRELGVADAIELLGWITGANKEEWLDRCHIFALPSHIEGLPVSMLEAMAAAQAVVVTQVGSIPEVITHGENGLLVPPAEVPPLAQALVTLATQPELRLRLAQKARQDVEQVFAAERVCEQLAAVYRAWG
jgi:glycosyltransferase involved in cell wall biosynthesis